MNVQPDALPGAGNIADSILGEGRLSPKHRALIAAACAMSLKCDLCATELSRQAMELGISREELIEVASLAQSIGVQSSIHQSGQPYHSHEVAGVQVEPGFSEWCWAQDDGCVLGATD